MKKVLLVLIPLAILAGGWFIVNKSKISEVPALVKVPEATDKNNTIVTDSLINDYKVDTGEDAPQTLSTSDRISEDAATASLNTDDYSYTELSKIGTKVLTDADFQNIQSRLHSDPLFLEDLITEFRYNADPERGKRIAALLGDLNDPGIIQAAAEMAYSGDPASQHIGLDLLSRLQPNNSEARDIAIELLTNETSPELLVSTMNVLATPSRNASNQQRVQLIDNLGLLSNHADPRVRSHSISLLGRWNPGGASAILTQGLNDPDSTVRARSVSAFIGKNNAGESTIYRLLNVAENSNEIKTTRQSALYALQKMQLSPDARARYEQAVITVRRTRQ